jgi:hypothetical protein
MAVRKINHPPTPARAQKIMVVMSLLITRPVVDPISIEETGDRMNGSFDILWCMDK